MNRAPVRRNDIVVILAVDPRSEAAGVGLRKGDLGRVTAASLIRYGGDHEELSCIVEVRRFPGVKFNCPLRNMRRVEDDPARRVVEWDFEAWRKHPTGSDQ